MIYQQASYRIRKERLADAEREIAAFAAELQRNKPRFIKYHIYRQAGDTATLFHLMSFPDQEAYLEHTQLPHVKRFVENMLALCEQGPDYIELQQVASVDRGV